MLLHMKYIINRTILQVLNLVFNFYLTINFPVSILKRSDGWFSAEKLLTGGSFFVGPSLILHLIFRWSWCKCVLFRCCRLSGFYFAPDRHLTNTDGLYCEKTKFRHPNTCGTDCLNNQIQLRLLTGNFQQTKIFTFSQRLFLCTINLLLTA